jgi:RNA polymerase sigma factor (sigma-70 family)
VIRNRLKSKAKPSSSDQFAAKAWASSRDDLRNFLLRRSRASEVVDDLVQEVFLRLLRYRSLHLVKDPLSFIYYLARNVLKDHQRRARAAPAQENPQAELTDETYSSVETQERLASAISTLPPTMREALLSSIDGKSDSQIAASLGISPATVQKYILRARAHLSRYLAVDHESKLEAP